MATAGELRHRIGFEKRAEIDDGYGNLSSGEFEEQFVVSAKVQARVGGESVQAARLASQQPVSLTIRRSSNTRKITEEWRAHDVRNDVYYNIRSIIDPDDRGAWIELLCQSGVAT
jgi:SPP1 family predicted phage head-tail adaptor